MKYTCECCGVEFNASPSRKRKYCSHACNARVNLVYPFINKKGEPAFRVGIPPEEKFDVGEKSNYPWGDGRVNGSAVVTGVDIVNKVIELATPRHTSEPTEHEIWLGKVRKSIKQTGHAYKYDSGGLVIGEYDNDGNLKEY